jgi:ribosomal protein S26
MSCLGVTKTGKPCARKATKGNYCWQHDSKDVHEEVLPIVSSNMNFISGNGSLFEGVYTPTLNVILIKAVLSMVHPSTGITTEALDFINTLTYNLYLQIPETKSIEELKEEVSKILPKDSALARHAISEIYKESAKIEARYDNITVSQIMNKIRITVIEYIVAEILELAGNVSYHDKKRRINYRHVMKAIANDEELKTLFADHIIPDQYIIYNSKDCIPLSKLKAILNAEDIKLSDEPLRFVQNYIKVQYFRTYTSEQLEDYLIKDEYDFLHTLIQILKPQLKGKFRFKQIADLLLTNDVIAELRKSRKVEVHKVLDDLHIPEVLITLLGEYF